MSAKSISLIVTFVAGYQRILFLIVTFVQNGSAIPRL